MTTRYSRHRDVRLAALDTEGVALHLGTRRYFTLSETGLTLMEALSSPRSVPELVAVLQGRYDVAEDRATASVSGFLKQCAGAELVVLEDA